MKATALIAAAALACGTVAYAQQQDRTARGEETVRAEQQHHGTASEKLRGAAHKLGEKTRHAAHRVGDAVRRTAKRDDHNDTRAMGAAGASHDTAAARRQRMDEAYAHWKAKQEQSR